MRPIRYTLGPLATPSANNIALSQTPAGAGALTLNGALVSGGVATLDIPRRVLFTTVSNESAKTFTVTGTDWFGNVITEAVTGPNATTGYTVRDYKTVTSITVSAALTGAVTVGTNDVASSQPFVPDTNISPYNIALSITVTGTINYTVQYTFDDVMAPSYITSTANWVDHPSLTSKTATLDSNIAYPVTGVRIRQNSGTGSVVFVIIEAGGGGMS